MNAEPYSDLKMFIAEHGANEFKPFAYYDKHLDCIRVRTLDCSVIEERLSRIFTVLKAAHADYEVSAGFNIKGVRHLFVRAGLAPEGVFTLAEIIDAIVRVYPDAFVKRVQEDFRREIENDEMRVSVTQHEAAA